MAPPLTGTTKVLGLAKGGVSASEAVASGSAELLVGELHLTSLPSIINPHAVFNPPAPTNPSAKAEKRTHPPALPDVPVTWGAPCSGLYAERDLGLDRKELTIPL